MTGVVLAIDYHTVHEACPLPEVLSDGDLGLVGHVAPVRINLTDGEDAAIRDAEVGAGQQERDIIRRRARVEAEDVVEQRQAIVCRVYQRGIDLGDHEPVRVKAFIRMRLCK